MAKQFKNIDYENRIVLVDDVNGSIHSNRILLPNFLYIVNNEGKLPPGLNGMTQKQLKSADAFTESPIRGIAWTQSKNTFTIYCIQSDEKRWMEGNI